MKPTAQATTEIVSVLQDEKSIRRWPPERARELLLLALVVQTEENSAVVLDPEVYPTDSSSD